MAKLLMFVLVSQFILIIVSYGSPQIAPGSGSLGSRNSLWASPNQVLNPTITDEAYTTEVYHLNGKGEDAGVVYCEMQGRENTSTDSIMLWYLLRVVDARMHSLLTSAFYLICFQPSAYTLPSHQCLPKQYQWIDARLACFDS